MDVFQVQNMIKKHEGLSLKVYKDTMGVLTVGYGHALHEGSRIPADVAERLFREDYVIAERGYQSLELRLDPVRRAVIISMVFNLGLAGVKKFKKMLAAIRNHDYELAALEMLDSKWASQVKRRADTLAVMMNTGEPDVPH